MYHDFLVNIPKDSKNISYNRRKGTVYIEYTYARRYIPEKKYNIPKRTTIGKQCPEQPDMMYPNNNFRKYFPEEAFPEKREHISHSSCLKVGGFFVMKKIMDDYELPQMLSKYWNEKGRGLFLDMAAYSIICENNAAQYYPDYAYNHPLLTKNQHVYSDSTISRFLSEISDDDRVGFLNDWNARRDHNERIYISYDATNKNCQSGCIDMAEFGHPKVDIGAPIINYAIAYDVNNQEPLFYEDYPGSIVDTSQLKYMLEKVKAYGYKNVGLILDRGYFSRDNINYIDGCGYSFVMMVKGRMTFVRKLILEHKGTFETKRICAIREFETYGITVPYVMYADDETIRYFHLYHSISKENAERTSLESNLSKMAEQLEKHKGTTMDFGKLYEHYFKLTYHSVNGQKKLFGYEEREDVIEQELRLCGYYVIVTSEKMTAHEALLLYKSRDSSEKLFRGDKSYLGNNSLRVSGNEAIDSKIFIEFVALIIRCKIYTQLKKRKMEMAAKPNYMTVPAALKELEKIEMIKEADGTYRLDHAITATQKTILGAFGVDDKYIIKKSVELGKYLANLADDEGDEEDGTNTEDGIDY